MVRVRVHLIAFSRSTEKTNSKLMAVPAQAIPPGSTTFEGSRFDQPDGALRCLQIRHVVAPRWLLGVATGERTLSAVRTERIRAAVCTLSMRASP
jgi:hypothetical protein